MEYVSETYGLTVAMLLSPKLGLTHVQLAAELAASKAAARRWHAKEPDARSGPVASFDEAERECAARWAAFDTQPAWDDVCSEQLITALERAISLMWNALPTAYRPHPPARTADLS